MTATLQQGRSALHSVRTLRGLLGGVCLVVAGFCGGWIAGSVVHRRRIWARMETGNGWKMGYGELGDTLFEQGISHVGFHAPRMKQRLAEIVGSGDSVSGAVGVVGVEWGSEVKMFANLGYRVHAFEPVDRFYRAMGRMLAENNRRAVKGREKRWDIRLHKVAAGDVCTGNVSMRYNTDHVKITEIVSRGCVDDFVKDELAVLSVDIQGNEVAVLKGARRLIRDIGVRSLWIEIFPCNQRVLEIFRLLDRDYVLFDFVPWGRPRGYGAGRTMSLMRHSSFVREDRRRRPKEFRKYFEWMCRKNRMHFRWMQTDIVAVRRDLVTEERLIKMGTLANDLFVQTVYKGKRKV